jgi:transglutaminase-like putative cysteine protease
MRGIDKRFLPAVAGIDLEQALNYIALEDVTLDFIYDKYTGARLLYRAGTRPVLEGVAIKAVAGVQDELQQLERLTRFVAERLPWAGYYHRATGRKLPTARGLDEEGLLASGYAWCNEQARVLCSLTQILGIPSRLVFGAARQGGGHVVVETLTAKGWLLIDQSLGYLFLRDGVPSDAYHVWHHESSRAYFGPIYKQLCLDLSRELGKEILDDEFSLSQLAQPIDGFEILGFHNHFVR